MDILLAAQHINRTAWVDALGRRLPQACVRFWTETDSAAADYLLYWKEAPEALKPRAGVKAIFNLGAGVDALLDVLRKTPDTLAATVPVIRLEDAGMARQMVEYAVYCALRYLRRFPEYEAQARMGKWRQLRAATPAEFPVGVLGAGVLGQPVARALQTLGFKVRLYSRSHKTLPGIVSYAGDSQLEAFASGLSLAINLLPNTPDTQNILDTRFFARMAPGSYLVNLARGAHVCDADLLAALDSGQLARAALDVFREEPLASSHAFWQHPKIEITPHVSACTLMQESIEQIATKIERHEQGEALHGIDLQRGY